MTNYNYSIHELTSGRWSMQNAETILPLCLEQSLRGGNDVSSLPEFSAEKHQASSSSFSNSEVEKKRYVAVIPIVGTITKYSTHYRHGTIAYAEYILNAAKDDSICGIVLSIDSGGGNLNAIPIIREAIQVFKATKKPILAHCSSCNSAAYWIASQCDLIFAESDMSDFGSIGIVCSFIDFDGCYEKSGAKVHTVFADESPDKNLAYRNALAGDYKLIKEEMTPLIKTFHDNVKSGRMKRLNTEGEGVLTGATFLAPEAILSIDAAIERAIIISQLNN